METFTQGQMDAFAVENVETERKRIHGILSRVLVEEKTSFLKAGKNEDGYFKVGVDYEEVQKFLDKVILGNRK